MQVKHLLLTKSPVFGFVDLLCCWVVQQDEQHRPWLLSSTYHGSHEKKPRKVYFLELQTLVSFQFLTNSLLEVSFIYGTNGWWFQHLTQVRGTSLVGSNWVRMMKSSEQVIGTAAEARARDRYDESYLKWRDINILFSFIAILNIDIEDTTTSHLDCIEPHVQ